MSVLRYSSKISNIASQYLRKSIGVKAHRFVYFKTSAAASSPLHHQVIPLRFLIHSVGTNLEV